MTNYLTVDGLQIPLMQDIIDQINAQMWLTFGNTLNLLPSSVGGQLVSISANAYTELWQNTQTVYQNWNPAGAGGVSLDNVAAVTGIRRLQATYGVGTITVNGTLGTMINAFALTASVSGSPSSQFQNTLAGTIGAGTNEIQHIAFDAVPDAGTWTLIYNGNSTGVLNFNATSGNVQSALNAITGLSVTVTGNTTAGFDVTFTGASGSQPQTSLSVGSNSLTHTAAPVVLTITTTTPGVFPHVNLPVQCLTTGEIPAYAGTLTVIVTPIGGVTTVTNASDITPGQNIETDSALRVRRLKSLAFPGSANPDAILASVLNVTGVINAIIDNNVTLITDADNTPGKSFQVIVLGGANQAIGDAIWSKAPAGISSYGTTTVTVVDASGNDQSVKFTRPSQIPIYVICYLTALADYPSGGDAALKEAIATYGAANFSVGDDVIAWRINIPAGTIAGIDNFSFTLGTVAVAQIDTLVWSGNFVTGNVINGTVNGVALTPTNFTTNNSTTLAALAAKIDAATNIVSAVSDGTHTITVTGTPAIPFTLTGFVVTGGASQPTAVVTNTTPVGPSGTSDITIAPTEISTWTTSNISVTHV